MSGRKEGAEGRPEVSRAALRSAETPLPAPLRQAVEALRERGPTAGRAEFERAVEALGTSARWRPVALLGRALTRAAAGDLSEGRADAAAALAELGRRDPAALAALGRGLARAGGDPEGLLAAAEAAGGVAAAPVMLERAALLAERGRLEDAAALWRDVVRGGDRSAAPAAHANLGRLLAASEPESALAEVEAALEPEADGPHVAVAASALAVIAASAVESGQLTRASALLARALELQRGTYDAATRAALLHDLGVVALERDEVAGAVSWFEEARVAAQQAEDDALTAAALCGLAEAARREGRLSVALGHARGAARRAGVADMPDVAALLVAIADDARDRGSPAVAAEALRAAERLGR